MIKRLFRLIILALIIFVIYGLYTGKYNVFKKFFSTGALLKENKVIYDGNDNISKLSVTLSYTNLIIKDAENFKIETNNKNVKLENTLDIQGIEVEKYSVDFRNLKDKNQDIVGWIKVKGTAIEYPVVKGADNSFYLTHSLDKSYNSAGWIFADYKNKLDGNDKNIVIYGHNRRDGTMFGSLQNVLKEEWYNNKENQYITFEKENEIKEKTKRLQEINIELGIDENDKQVMDEPENDELEKENKEKNLER